MSLLSKITSPLKKAFQERERYLVYKEYRDHFKNRLIQHGINPNVPVKGEEKYVDVWSKLYPNIERYSYRFFSSYVGENPYIIPEGLGRLFIEPYLNPREYAAFYSDKNIYDCYLLEKDSLPKVYIRCMDGMFYDSIFNPLANNKVNVGFTSTITDIFNYLNDKEIVVKITRGTGGGRSVCRFVRTNNSYISDDGEELDGKLFTKFGDNFVIQEVLHQSLFFSNFCHSSINTIRIYLYRSVVDDVIEIYSSVLRIGRTGSFVDNSSCGGGFVKIDIETGKLDSKVYNEEGYIFDTFNDINFTNNDFYIPQWNEVKIFAVSIFKQLRHCHLVALDLSIDINDTIRLIEFNIGDTSYWHTMLVGDVPFGAKIQEVIDYCVERKKNDPRFK